MMTRRALQLHDLFMHGCFGQTPFLSMPTDNTCNKAQVFDIKKHKVAHRKYHILNNSVIK